MTEASTYAPNVHPTITLSGGSSATAFASSAPLPPNARRRRISPVAPAIFSTKTSLIPAERAGPRLPVNSPTAQASPLDSSTATARQADSPSPLSREVHSSRPRESNFAATHCFCACPTSSVAPSGAIASAMVRTPPMLRIQLTSPPASVRSRNVPGPSRAADPAISLAPADSPARARPPSASAASAAGDAFPISGRTSHPLPAKVRERANEQAHSAPKARAGRARMPAVCRSDPGSALFAHARAQLLRSEQGESRPQTGSTDRAFERRDPRGDAKRHLRLGSAPVARPRTRHARRLHIWPRVHRHGRGGRSIGEKPTTRRPGCGAVQHLLRQLLLLLARPLRELREHEPEQRRGARGVRVFAHQRRLPGRRGGDREAGRREAGGRERLRGLGKSFMRAGVPVATRWAIQRGRKGGNVSTTGGHGPPWNRGDLGTAMNKGLTLRRTQCNVGR